jgi:predicted esterase
VAVETFVHRFEPSPGAEPGERTKTLLLLHGTGGDENDLLPLGRLLDPTAALLSARGRVLENGMPRWFRRLAEGIFDEEDLIRRTHELARFIGDAAATYAIDRKRLFAVGFSNGANIAAALLLLEPGAIAGGVLFRAMVPLRPASLPDLSGAPVLLLAGRADPLIPADQVESLAGLLRDAGARVTLEWSDAAHGLVHSEVERARRWLAER